MGIQDTQLVVHITTDILKGCNQCTATIDGVDNFEGAVNHYIQDHGYKLLHVGQETGRDAEGKPWHKTVAVLGRE